MVPDGRQPCVLTIAGSDSSGSAGVQADLRTFAALGLHGASVISAVTAQNTVGVQGVQPVEADFVIQQLDSVLADLRVAAIKTGMLANAEVARAVARRLADVPGVPVVVDPVMIASSGPTLLANDAIAVYRTMLLHRATLLTPNLPEAARLLGEPEAATLDAQTRQAQALVTLGCRAVLLKGGHGHGDELVDILCEGHDLVHFRHARIATRNTRGTGCTLSAAIAARLSSGAALRDAVANGISYVQAALAAGATRDIGTGPGPVDQLFSWRARGF